jgi:radical SAM family uncharacterized protein
MLCYQSGRMRHLYADFIARVAKPARYLGGEYQSVTKDPAAVTARVCLAFPDVYDIGMSHLGTKILYSLLNRDPDIWCERAFAPWLDMEQELRTRGLPLVSLESQTRLAEFDVVGISLQYELTFTNMLTLLDLGGIALRTADRAPDAPLVLVGGSVASHPEPVAPFIDAAFIGEGEELLAGLVRAWAALRREIRAGARTRRDALAELAAAYPVYVPELYATEIDADTGMVVVGAPLDPRAPARIARAMVPDLDKYPFPADAPVPYAEAVFERASVEIARGCTEGCRFCQAGMIYRPVRERSPQSIVDSLLGGVDKAGYEETGLTCLSTADFSSITPLVKRIARELKTRGVSMSVASLRAYGLNDDLLDELALTRISGLTFAPEAGTQRMRDVVNKNVTEAHVEDSARRVFSRGWHRLKLYFMIGLPTEEDSDVRGIVETGARMLAVGRSISGGRAEVTVSVSSHVPKPHTPLQWCAQDDEGEIRRKQGVLRNAVREKHLRLKVHDSGISYVEGVLSRGDRRIADVIEDVWRAGARFDGWDEVFDLDRWRVALAARGVDMAAYMGTRPVTARLPWDHIDVGLEDGFLLKEYRKALKGRASPPCGKVFGQLIHHTNVEDAEADRKKLVCYDCGVACDLTKMREERIVALRSLGALARPAAPVAPAIATEELPGDIAERGGGSPAEHDDAAPAIAIKDREVARAERVRRAGFAGADAPYARYRIRFAKIGRAAFLGHLDLARLWARTFRRADLELALSRGFSPKPRMAFGPALGLGVPSLGEVMDIDLEHAPRVNGAFARPFAAPTAPREAVPPDEVARRLAAVCPEGLVIDGCEPLAIGAPGLGKLVTAIDLILRPAPDGIAHDAARLARIGAAFLARSSATVVRGAGELAGPAAARKDERLVDVRALVSEVDVIAGDDAARVGAALGWAEGPLLRVRVGATAAGSARPVEVARALGVWGDDDPRAEHALVARLGVVMTPVVPAATELTSPASATSPSPAAAPLAAR